MYAMKQLKLTLKKSSPKSNTQRIGKTYTEEIHCTIS